MEGHGACLGSSVSRQLVVDSRRANSRLAFFYFSKISQFIANPTTARPVFLPVLLSLFFVHSRLRSFVQKKSGAQNSTNLETCAVLNPEGNAWEQTWRAFLRETAFGTKQFFPYES